MFYTIDNENSISAFASAGGAAAATATPFDTFTSQQDRPSNRPAAMGKGATITEIMDKMGWQRHTVRAFMAGAMKKAGFTVKSFKPEGGQRSYRLPK
jgi:Protein of unknown function (DUF3489)